MSRGQGFGRNRRLRAMFGGAMLLLVLAACGNGPVTTTPAGIATTPATATATRTPVPSLDQRIDAYIATLTPAQQIGQTLMLAVYANAYNANLDQALTQWHLGSAIFFPNYNGGPLMPATPLVCGSSQRPEGARGHAAAAGDRRRRRRGGSPLASITARRHRRSSSPRPAIRSRPIHQAQTDAQRMRTLGLNVDFAPLADVDQGGGIDPSRTFGTTPAAVTTYAGAFLDGLQQNGVGGTLKHWPGLGASTGNPDFVLPTVNHTQAQLNAIDFAPFRRCSVTSRT